MPPRNNKGILLALALVVLAAGIFFFMKNEKEAYAEINGAVTYRERIALPPGSVVEVSLQDVSRADAPATVIATDTYTTEGENVPLSFSLRYKPSDIDPRMTYAITARILVDGELRWTTTEHIAAPVSEETAASIEIPVEMVASTEEDAVPSESNEIEDALLSAEWSWQYTSYPDGTRLDAPSGDEFVLTLGSDGRLSSTTDCNNLGGTFVRDGEVLSFGAMVSTLMYCEGSLEGDYSKDLALTTSYTIESNTLTLNLNRDAGTMVFKKK